jgi:hypothetical protein
MAHHSVNIVARSTMTLALVAVLASANARAEPTPSGDPNAVRERKDQPRGARVILPSCPHDGFDRSAFLEVLRVELATSGVEEVAPSDVGSSGEGADDRVATIEIEVKPCTTSASAQVVVTVTCEATQKGVVRAFPLAGTPPNARPRALALAVAEVLRASWIEIATPDAPRATSSRGDPDPDDIPRREVTVALGPPRRPTLHASVAVAIALQTYPSLGSALLGPRADLAMPAGMLPLLMHLHGAVLFGRASDPLGDVDLRLATAGAALLIAGVTDTSLVALGPNIDVGWGTADGNPIDSTTQHATASAAIVVPALLGLGSLRIAPNFWATLTTELGMTLGGLEARADGRTVGGMSGPSFGVALGLTYALPSSP